MLVATMATAVAAGSLPIKKAYCEENLLIDAEGWHGEEDCAFKSVQALGKDRWRATLACQGDPALHFMELQLSTKGLVLREKGAADHTLRECRSTRRVGWK